jgi:tetratricopeptide (TPR) repeat protein
MPFESYKKWLVIVIVLVLAGVVIFAITSSDYKKEKATSESSKRTPMPPGPIGGPGISLPTQELPDDPVSLAALGDRYFEQQMYERAIETYEKTLKLNPSDVDTYNDLGLAYNYMGKTDIAIEKLKKGSQVMPSYQRIWLSLGYVLLSSGRNEEAKPALEKAVELAPESDVGREAQRMIGLL